MLGCDSFSWPLDFGRRHFQERDHGYRFWAVGYTHDIQYVFEALSFLSEFCMETDMDVFISEHLCAGRAA